MMRRCRGFTLIELLVVVAIIAVLIAILLPSLGRAKMQAKRVQCQAALKGWGQGIFTYASDNQGWFGCKTSAGTWASSPGVYNDYVNNQTLRKFRVCPAEIALPGGRPDPAGGFDEPGTNKRVQVNYLHVRFNPKSKGTAWKMSNIGAQSTKMLMCDGYWNNGTNVAQIQCNGSVSQDGLNLTATDNVNGIPAFNMGEILKDRHGGNGQILFLDSHTESVPWTDWVANIPDQGWASGPPPTAELGKTWTVINDNQ